MRRDRLTFAMMIGVPLMQLILFGYAINTDPKHLPAALLVADQSVFARSLVRALENSGYFEVVRQATSEAEANDLLVRGDVQFVISIPEDFERELLRGQRPAVLVEADATDPVATGNALAALASLNRTALLHDLKGPLASLAGGEPAFELRVHRRYNPEGATEYNIVPGLIGTILTMTMVMMTAIAVTRERERGTMENLLAMPVRPFEVMLGKIVPFVVVGYVQVAVILLAGRVMFGVPVLGSLWLLSLAVVLFIAANLAVGFTFSTMAENQLQAMQMTFFFFLPSLAPVRLPVPVPRHAGVGAGARLDLPAHPFPAHRARHPAQGQRLERDRAGDLADRPVHARGRRDRAEPLPRDPRLTGFGSGTAATSTAPRPPDGRPASRLEGRQEGRIIALLLAREALGRRDPCMLHRVVAGRAQDQHAVAIDPSGLVEEGQRLQRAGILHGGGHERAGARRERAIAVASALRRGLPAAPGKGLLPPRQTPLSGRQHQGAAQVHGDGEELQLECVLDQRAITDPAVAVPALEDREGPLDRRPQLADRPVAGAAGGIERPPPVVAGHDAVGDAALGQLPAIPPAVVALVGIHRLLVALHQGQERRLVRDVRRGEDRLAHQARAVVDRDMRLVAEQRLLRHRVPAGIAVAAALDRLALAAADGRRP